MVVSEGKAFYAYIHYKPDFTPFYVGKGRLKRANSLKCRNQYYMATVEKYGVGNILIGKFKCSSETNAFELEVGMIKCLKKAGVKLTNFTDGGEGSSGRVYSLETREKMSVASMGNTNMLGKTHSLEAKAKMSAAKKGKPKSAEHRAKLSAWQIGRVLTAEHRAKISAGAKGRPKSAEHRAKMVVAQKLGNTAWLGKFHSLESKLKMSAAHKLRRKNGPT